MDKVPYEVIAKSLQSHFPPENMGELHPIYRALISALALRDGMRADRWLEMRMRVLLLQALPPDARDAVLRCNIFEEKLAYGELPDWLHSFALEGVSPTSTEVPAGCHFVKAVEKMREDVEAAANSAASGAFPLLPLPAVDLGPDRHTLFDPNNVPASKFKDGERKAWFDQLRASGTERQIPVVTPAMTQAVERLLDDAPNMRDATLFVLGQLALAHHGRHHLNLPPMLLIGPPAAGKTWWAERIASALGVGFEFVTMPSVTSSFELSGSSTSWTSGKPGRILRTFMATQAASPVFVFDEIDKVSSGNYDPEAALLNLVERATAKHFHDEFFDADFDVSRSIFIATANRPDRMDFALRSRFREIYVRAPTRTERMPIIASLWRIYRANRSDLNLPEQLDDEVMSVLVDKYKNARETQRLLDDGLGNAATRAGPLRLVPGDVGGPIVRLVRTELQSKPRGGLEGGR